MNYCAFESVRWPIWYRTVMRACACVFVHVAIAFSFIFIVKMCFFVCPCVSYSDIDKQQGSSNVNVYYNATIHLVVAYSLLRMPWPAEG